MQVNASQSNEVENIQQRLTKLEKQSQSSKSKTSNLTLTGLVAGLGLGLLSLSSTSVIRYGMFGLTSISTDLPFFGRKQLVAPEHIIIRLLGSSLVGAAAGTVLDACLRCFSNAIEVQAANKKLNDNSTAMHNLSQRPVELA